MSAIIVIGLCVACCWFQWKVYSGYVEIKAQKRGVLARSRATQTWESVKGRILELGHAIDYAPEPAPGEPEQAFYERAEKILSDIARHGNLLIRYEYRDRRGRRIESRRVSPFEGSTDLSVRYFYSVHVGDAVDVWYDPKKPSRSVLVRPEVQDVSAEFSRRLRKSVGGPAFSMAVSAVAAIAVAVYLP